MSAPRHVSSYRDSADDMQLQNYIIFQYKSRWHLIFNIKNLRLSDKIRIVKYNMARTLNLWCWSLYF